LPFFMPGARRLSISGPPPGSFVSPPLLERPLRRRQNTSSNRNLVDERQVVVTVAIVAP
jgi:hypothetical protein